LISNKTKSVYICGQEYIIGTIKNSIAKNVYYWKMKILEQLNCTSRTNFHE